MSSRSGDWLRQAHRDLDQARASQAGGMHEWACFAAHQAAEKALKAVYQARGGEARGHTVSNLLKPLLADPGADALLESARALDKHYIPTRYPNGFASGAPMDFYSAADAGKAIDDSAAIIRRCDDLLARPPEGPRGA